jgi:uncharacterized protein YkwD
MPNTWGVGRHTALAVCLIALLVGTFAPGAVHSAVDSSTAGSAGTTVAFLEGGVLAELNDVRAAHGLRPLALSPQLSAAARQHNAEMLTDGYFEHESFGGSPFWKRIQRFYAKASFARWSVGENLLWSSPDIQAKRAVKVWMASPGHRENILEPDWREIGISALHVSSSVGTFGGGAVTVITTDFGIRR